MKQLLILFSLFAINFGFSQNDNPYAKFGYKGNTIKTPQEHMEYMLIIPNQDTLSVVSKIGIEPKESRYYLFDKENNVVFQDTLTREQTSRFFSVDPLEKDYPHNAPYAFSENRVLDGVELEGLEWKSIKNDLGDYVTWGWDPENAFDKSGNLKNGYYTQALAFFDYGTFDRNSNFNMGSAGVMVLKEDGSTKLFEATTLPADDTKHATIKGGELYEARWGKHKGKKPALNLHNTYDVEAQYRSRIPIEQEKHPNPEYAKRNDPNVGGAYATSVNIHWAYGGWNPKTKGKSNNYTTGFDRSGKACSTACPLVRGTYNEYQKDFIPHLNKKNKVGVTVLRFPYNKTSDNE